MNLQRLADLKWTGNTQPADMDMEFILFFLICRLDVIQIAGHGGYTVDVNYNKRENSIVLIISQFFSLYYTLILSCVPVIVTFSFYLKTVMT